MKKLKKIEKKIVFGALFCVFAGAVSFAQSESSLAFQMQNAYDSGFYPGVVLYADQILSSESKSVYEAKAMVFKGESLFKMGKILLKFFLPPKNLQKIVLSLIRPAVFGLAAVFLN